MKGANNIAFIGLGVMGAPMAGHLAEKSGATVTVYNRTEEKADQWLHQYKGRKAKTPAAAAEAADMVMVCVGNDHDLRAVLTGPQGVSETVQPGTIIVDHTTVSAQITREMNALFQAKGCGFIDAPVSGGQSGAETGQLTVMAGGDENDFATAQRMIMGCYAREMIYMGPSGSGQLTKMVNQICIAGLLQGLSEGLAFGLNAGLDLDKALTVMGQGAAQSWQMDHRGRTMIRDEFDFGFAVDWMVKDLEIALATAAENGMLTLTVTGQVLEFYKELQQQGRGRLDTSSLIRRLMSSDPAS